MPFRGGYPVDPLLNSRAETINSRFSEGMAQNQKTEPGTDGEKPGYERDSEHTSKGPDNPALKGGMPFEAAKYKGDRV